MSVIDKWLSVHRDEFKGPATTATPATIPDHACNANDLDVATGCYNLLHFQPRSPHGEKCSRIVAGDCYRKTITDHEVTPNVAGVAIVAGGQNQKRIVTSTESSGVTAKSPPRLHEEPLDWLSEISRLDPDFPPHDVPPRRWQQLIQDCGRLHVEGVFGRAAQLGWTALDLFGCDECAPYARIDQMGLAWLVTGSRVVMISTDAAVLEAPTGSRQTYWRKCGGLGRVLAWELEPRRAVK